MHSLTILISTFSSDTAISLFFNLVHLNRISIWALIEPLQNFFFWKYSFVNLDVYFGLLTDWKLKFFFICNCLTLYLDHSPSPSWWEAIPWCPMLPPPCFTFEMVLFGWWAALFLHQTCFLELCQKKSGASVPACHMVWVI